MEKKATELEQGDGQGAYLSDMTEEEYATHLHEVEHGWRPFMDRVLGRAPRE